MAKVLCFCFFLQFTLLSFSCIPFFAFLQIYLSDTYFICLFSYIFNCVSYDFLSKFFSVAMILFYVIPVFSFFTKLVIHTNPFLSWFLQSLLYFFHFDISLVFFVVICDILFFIIYHHNLSLFFSTNPL